MTGESRASGDRPPAQPDRAPDPRLAEGRDADARHAWQESYRIFVSAAANAPLSAADLRRLAVAAWWTGHLADCIAAWEQAYAASVGHDPAAAASAAMELTRNYFAKGEPSVASAWLSRAERLLADTAPCVAHGYLSRMRSVIAFEGDHDSTTALEHSRTTLEIAARFQDRDLMALALHDQGRALEIDHAGDGFFVAFPEAVPALACAVAIQRTLSEHRRAHGFAPRVRIGLHAAPAAHRGGGYQGKGVHEAARIAASAEGDQIVASAGTVEETAPFPHSEPCAVQLPGLHEPINLVTIDWRP